MVFGQLFIPVLQKVMPVINGVVIAIKRLVVSIAELLGVKIDFESFGQGYSDLSDGADDLSDSLGGVAASAKKAKAGLRAFDELKVINMPETSGGVGGGTGAGIDLTDQILKATEEYEKAWNEAFSNMENKAQDWANKIEKALEPVKKIFQDFAVGDFFQAGKDTSALVPGIFNFFAEAIDKVDWYGIGKKIGEFFAGIDWFEVLKSTGNLIWQAFKAIIETYAGMFAEAPFTTTIITLATLPRILKKITSSKYITGFKRLGDVLADSLWAIGAGFKDKNIGTGFSLAIQNIRDNLTPLQKFSIGAIGIVGEFSLVKDGFKELTEGSDNLVASLGKIAGGAAVAVGALKLIGLSNPWTAAIVGITGVSAALKGISDAFDKKRVEEVGEAIKNAMSNPGDVPLSEIASQFQSAFSEASKGFDVISEKSSEMDNVQKNIEDTWTEIYKIQEAMDNGVLSVDKGKQELERLFGELVLLTEQKFSTMNTVIMSAYGEGGSFRTVLDNLGLDTEAAIDTMITYGYQNSQRAKEIAQELVGMDINSEEYKALTTELASLTGEMDKFEQATSNFTYDMNSLQGKIDYSEIFLQDGSIDTEALQRYLDEAATALSDYETSLDDAGKEISQYWQEIYNSTTATDEQRAVAKANLDYIPMAIEAMKNDAQSQVRNFTDLLQTDFANKSKEILENATEEYKNKNFFGRAIETIFGRGENTVTETTRRLGENAKKLSDSISSSLGEDFVLGYSGGIGKSAENAANAGAQMVSGTITAAQKEQVSNSPSKVAMGLGEDFVSGYILGIENKSEGAIGSARGIVSGVISAFQGISNPLKEIGVNAMQGFENGIGSMGSSITEKAKGIANGVTRTIKSALEIHSPSRVMFELGDFTMQGFKKGIENLYRPITNSVKAFSQDVAIAPI